MKSKLVIYLILVSFVCPNFIFSAAKSGFFGKFYHKYFIETGSYIGDGITDALESGFNEICSIELSEKYYLYCKEKFANHSNVHCYLGDSGKILEEIMADIQEPVTFWLDGHYSSGGTARGETNTPLLRELEIIKKHCIKNHTIIVDDIRLLGTEEFDFISLSKVIEMILDINPNYTISYHDGYFQNDILVAEMILQ